jgi:tetratricopeptide (TPR) repeat protein
MSILSNGLLKAGVVAVTLAASFASPVLASGGGGGGGGGGSNPNNTNTVPDCVSKYGKGWAYSNSQGKCVKVSELDDKELYTTGRALALAGYYGSALDTLNAIRDKHDSMVLTMIGYSTRKLGHTAEGIAIYQEALAIDPNNVNTHEYLGEGYIVAGRVDLAKAELVTLKNLCGTGCEQYQDLNNALLGHPDQD